MKILYNGANFCGDCGCGCPVIYLDEKNKMIVINDPAKPENGEYKMTVDEYNTLLKNARPLI